VKIKLSSIYANEHVQAQPGSVIDVSDEEGQSLIEARCGLAVKEKANVEKANLEPAAPAAPETKAETADTSAPETAAKRTGPRGSRGRSTAAAPAAPETT
jgi:hypothetical protein